MNEKKSWGSGDQAKIANAIFLCWTHNLLLLIEQVLRNENVDNEVERGRKKKRLDESIENGGNFVSTFVQRFTVRSVKFIRWLRNFSYREVLWDPAKARLVKIYSEI